MNSFYRKNDSGMTLTEVMFSMAIGGLVFGGVLNSYIQSANRSEWSAYNFAGHSLAMQKLEMARAAKWDTQASPPVDQLVASNFPPTVDVLDVPLWGTNVVYATTTAFISTISVNPPVKMIRVETTWAFRKRTSFTNTTATYRAPDQ